MCGVAIFNQVRGSVPLLPSYRAHSHYALLGGGIPELMIFMTFAGSCIFLAKDIRADRAAACSLRAYQ